MNPCKTILTALFLMIPLAAPASADDLPDAEELVQFVLKLVGGDPQVAEEAVREFVEGLTEEEMEDLQKVASDPLLSELLQCINANDKLECVRGWGEGKGGVCLTPHIGLPSSINELMPQFSTGITMPIMTGMVYDSQTQSIQPGYYLLSWSVRGSCGISGY
jgi:hypothetical protein